MPSSHHHKFTGFEAVLHELGGFGRYQYLLAFWFQIAVMSAGSQLCYWIFAGIIPEQVTCPQTTAVNATCFEVMTFRSIAIEWNLLGSQRYLVTFVNLLQTVGLGLGGLAIGHFSDNFGRRLSCIFSACGLLVFALAAPFSPDWRWFAGLRFGVGLFTGAHVTGIYTLIFEHLLPRSRLYATCAIQWPVSIMYLALLAYLAGNWSTLGQYICIMSVFDCLLLIFVLSESPKWLLLKGKTQRGINVLRRIGRLNGCGRVNVGELLAVHMGMGTGAEAMEGSPLKTNGAPTLLTPKASINGVVRPPTNRTVSNHSYHHLFKETTVRRLALAFGYSFFEVAIVSYGLAFNLSNLAGDVSLNVFIDAVCHMAVMIMVALLDTYASWFGRRMMHQIGLIATTICTFTLMFIKIFCPKQQILTSAIAFIGSAFTEFIWIVIVLYGMELFPTQLRTMGYALGNFFGRVGIIVAGQAMNLYLLWQPGMFLLFGIVGLINIVVAALWLPNTKNAVMADLEERGAGEVEVEDAVDV